jgi:hypothetical protein
MTPSAERFRNLELVHYWFYTQTAFLIPTPEDNANNVDAVVKPFQFWVCQLSAGVKASQYFIIFFKFHQIIKVWMGLLIASASVIITISVFNRILKTRNRSLINGNREMSERSQRVGVTETVFMYIIATLLGQGKTPLAILT